MPTALHLANLRSSNVGNGALMLGTERVLREDWGHDWNFNRLAWDDFTFNRRPWDASFVQEANRHDLLLINGAVTFNGRAYLKNTGSRLDLPLDLWRDIRVPILCYGLSHRFWPGGTYHHLEALKTWLRLMESSPRFVLGLRNDGTREWLRALTGLALPRAVEVVDPAMFVPVAEDAPAVSASVEPPHVILALNDEDSAQRFPSAEHRRELLKSLAEALADLLQRRGLELKLALHYFDDFRAAADFIELLSPAFAHQQVSTFGPVRCTDAPAFYAKYRRARAVIAMRVHSMSPALGLGCQTLPLTTQPRMQKFLEDLGLEGLAVTSENPTALKRDLTRRLDDTLDHPAGQKPALDLARLRQRVHKANVVLRETLGL